MTKHTPADLPRLSMAHYSELLGRRETEVNGEFKLALATATKYTPVVL